MAPDALVLDTLAIFRAVVCDRQAGVPAAVIAARFHNSLVRLLADACDLIRERTGLNLVALSGGVMQNALLFTRLQRALAALGFEVLTHTLTPPNDGSISLGQVAVAAARIKRGKGKGEKAKSNPALSRKYLFSMTKFPFGTLRLNAPFPGTGQKSPLKQDLVHRDFALIPCAFSLLPWL